MPFRVTPERVHKNQFTQLNNATNTVTLRPALIYGAHEMNALPDMICLCYQTLAQIISFLTCNATVTLRPALIYGAHDMNGLTPRLATAAVYKVGVITPGAVLSLASTCAFFVRKHV
jgi:hypothetical protein